MRTIKLLFTLAFFCSVLTLSIAQDIPIDDSAVIKSIENRGELKPCGVPPATAAQKKYILEVVDKAVESRNAGTTCIPIRIHIVQLDGGTGGISLGDINIGMSYLNKFYFSAGIEFYICTVNYINSTAWYTFDDSEEAAMTAAHSVDDAINIYFVDDVTLGGSGACGYAYTPSNNDVTLTIIMDNGCTTGNENGTLVHELGHFFSLLHTHQDTENGNLDPDAEHVPRSGGNSNCTTAGDLLCDTEADPNGSNDGSCNFINDGTDSQDVHGNTYAPDIDNIMSYYSDFCGGIFTTEQYTRISNGLTTRLGHTAYDLGGCAPASVTDPSGMTPTVNNSYGVDLSWTDNAGNETGYLIERSSDGGTTYAQLSGAGVAPDVTTYTDNTVSANTTYHYRVKASNDDCNDYSTAASVDVGLVYCVPTHQSNSCTIGSGGTLGVGIYNFELDGDAAGDISNMENGCTGALSVFSSTNSADVTAGNGYNVEVNFQLNNPPSGSYFSQYVTIWIDANQDGDFEDSGENLYQATSADGPSITIPITIPATATNGNTTLRVRTGWSSGGEVTSPCGYWALGETEDYELVVSGSLPVELIEFAGRLHKSEVLLNWQTATETGNDYFLIEKSVDGRNFQKLGTIQGSGNTHISQQYELLDQEPAIGTNYYRLTQYDMDGTYEVFDRIVAVEYFVDGEIAVQPNPVQGDQIQLIYQSRISGDLEVDIHNATGQQIKTLNVHAVAARNVFDISLNGLGNGVYIIRTAQQDNIQTLRFVKTN